MENTMPAGNTPPSDSSPKTKEANIFAKSAPFGRHQNRDIYSFSLDLEGTGEKINFMMVPNRPKPKAQPAPKGEEPPV
jgi:hypothetical protein